MQTERNNKCNGNNVQQEKKTRELESENPQMFLLKVIMQQIPALKSRKRING